MAVDYNAYWDTIAGTADPIEEATESAVENSDGLGMFIILFFFLVVVIAIVSIIAFSAWRK